MEASRWLNRNCEGESPFLVTVEGKSKHIAPGCHEREALEVERERHLLVIPTGQLRRSPYVELHLAANALWPGFRSCRELRVLAILGHELEGQRVFRVGRRPGHSHEPRRSEVDHVRSGRARRDLHAVNVRPGDEELSTCHLRVIAEHYI